MGPAGTDIADADTAGSLILYESVPAAYRILANVVFVI